MEMNNTFLLRDDHVVVAKHMRDERTRNDNTYATKTEVGDIQSDRIVSTNDPNKGLIITNGEVQASMDINLGESGEIYKFRPSPAQYAISLMSRNDCDYRYVQKDENALNNVLSPNQDYSFNNKKLIELAPGTVGTDAVNKNQLDLKRDTTARDNSIQHSTTNAALICSTANKIDIKVNGNTRGYFQQPVGQATTPLGLVSTDKLQFQSDLSSISAYGSKPLNDPLNTHGLYVTGVDDAAKNVQSTVNVSQGNAQVYLTAGHVNPGSGMVDFCALAANGSLQLSGGLSPGIIDKQLLLYAAARNQALPIQSDGKMGYTASANIAITEATQFPTKAYTDTQVATKLSLSGGTMTGPIILAGQPELSTHASNRSYVDQVGASKLSLIGGTMTGNLILNAAPTSDLMASTKKYVDDSAALRVLKSGDTMTGPLVLSGLPTLNTHAASKAYIDSAVAGIQQTTISTTNGYKIETLSDRFRFSTGTPLNFLEMIYANSQLTFDQKAGSSSRFNLPDSGAVDYSWSYKSLALNRPLLSIIDKGTEATQCNRISSVNSGGINEVFIQLKPNAQRIELNVPVYQTTSVGVTENNQLATKKYVDDTLTLNTVPARIQNALNSVRLTAQSGGDITIEQEPYGAEYVVLTKNTVRVDNGTQLTLNRGTTSLIIRDNNTGTANIEANRPLLYNGITIASSDDQLTSRRMNDARYRRSDQNIDLGSTYRITNLPSPLIPSEPVTLGLFDNALLYFRQCVTFGFTVLEVPSSPEAWASDANAITNITYIETGAGVAGYYTVSVDPNLFNGSNYVVNCQWYSTRSGVSIVDSQVAPLVVGNYQRTSFTIYARDTTGGTQQNQIIGTLTARGW